MIIIIILIMFLLAAIILGIVINKALKNNSIELVQTKLDDKDGDNETEMLNYLKIVNN